MGNSDPRIDTQTVLHVAKLARLAVTDQEAASLATELGAIVAYVDRIAAAQVPDVTTPPDPMSRRPDQTSDGGSGEAALRQAPAAIGRFIHVPVVVPNDD